MFGHIKNLFFLGLILSCSFAHGQSASDTTINSPVQTNQPEVVSHPMFLDVSLSPDGKRMVYIELINGLEQFFIADTNFRNQRQLTFEAANHEDPAWAPNGNFIAFTSIKANSETIFLMDTLGNIKEQVSPEAMKAIHPSWSADSRRVYFCSDDDLQPPRKNESDIYSFNLNSNELKKIITGGTNTFPVLSPDGKTIAFRHMIGERNSEIFLANADGTDKRNISNHPAFDGWPSWSPDGQWIAFASNRNSNYKETTRNVYQIFIMNKNGEHVKLLANTIGRATAPRWSPDGKFIYFTNCVHSTAFTECNIMRVLMIE